MKIKGILIFVLTFLMIIASLGVPVMAADNQLVLESLVWNAQNQSNTKTDNFEPGDTLTLWVKTNQAIDLGGLRIKLTYETDKFSYITNSALYMLSDAEANVMANEKNKGTISIVFDTTKKQNGINGEFLSISFKALSVSESTTAEFKVAVLEAWDSTSSYNSITIADDSHTVNISAVVVPEEFLELVKKLENITTDSANDIAAAETAFNALSAQQKAKFKAMPQYSVFSKAKGRYNALMEAAAKKELDDAAAKYLKDNPILNKKLSKVTLSDAKKVEVASEAYRILDPRVKARLTQVPDKISALEEAIEGLEQVKNFKADYASLWETDEEVLLMDAAESMDMVNVALIMYSTCNDFAKGKLSKEYKILNDLKEKLQKQLDQNALDAEIEAEVIEYQKFWLKVLTLNRATASLKDKTAIEMAIEAYGKLSPAAQEVLAPRYENLKNLLTVINSYSAITTPTTPPAQTTPTTPSAPVVQQTPIGSNQTITNNQINEVIKEVAAENANPVVKYLAKNTAKVIWFLFILLAVAVLCAAYSYIYYKNLKKKVFATDLTQEVEE